MKNLTLIFENFEAIHLDKDVGYIPRILSKNHNLNCEIVCYKNENNKKLFYIDGKIKVIKIKNNIKIKRFYFISMIKYILKNSRNIDNLMLFHINKGNFWYVLFYKFLNPKGKLYLKMDADIRIKDLFCKKIVSLREKFYHWRFLKQFDYVLEKADLISIETKKIHKILLDYNKTIENKLIYLPNGFYENDIEYQVKSYQEKENIIVSIARFGTYQKNSELLLESLEKVSIWKDWKVILIGSIEENFKKNIEEFYIKNPILKNKVIFTGPIYDKNIVYDYLSKGKVFLMTSRYESFALVLTEASYFGNYIVSTSVGISDDITNGSTLGKIVQSDPNQLSNVLDEIILGKNDLNQYYKSIIQNSRNSFLAHNQIKFLYEQMIKKGFN